MSDEPTLEGKLEFVGYEDGTQVNKNPFFKMGQMMAEKDARIRELERKLRAYEEGEARSENLLERQSDLLEECERALDGVLNNAVQDIDVQMRKDEYARATLAKLRAQEKADE